MITNAQKAELRRRGYADEEIRDTSPTEAHRILTPAPRPARPLGAIDWIDNPDDPEQGGFNQRSRRDMGNAISRETRLVELRSAILRSPTVATTPYPDPIEQRAKVLAQIETWRERNRRRPSYLLEVQIAALPRLVDRLDSIGDEPPQPAA